MSHVLDLRPTTISYFQLIVRLYGDSEETRAAILEGTGVSETELGNPHAQIHFSQQMRQLENMNRLYGEGWILETPVVWRTAAHGAFGVAATTAASVGAAFEVLARYVSVRTPNQKLKIIRSPGFVALRHGLVMPAPEPLRRTVVEIVFLGVGSILSLILGRDQAKTRFDFVWDEPPYGDKLRKELGGRVRFGAPTNSIVIPAELMSVNSPFSDPVLHQGAIERLEQMMREEAAPEGVRARVARLLGGADTGRISASAAARILGLSQRTLVRRLADAGVTYRDMIEAELKARARRLLDSGVLTRGEIAERLGFADATGFSRACRRWFSEAG